LIFESRQIWLYIEEKNLKIKNSRNRLNCQKYESVLNIFLFSCFEFRQIWLYRKRISKIKNSQNRLNCLKYESVLKIFLISCFEFRQIWLYKKRASKIKIAKIASIA